jgi:hypothetical protein
VSLPFTVDEFFGVFAVYNQRVWPAQVLLYILAFVTVALLYRHPRSRSRYISLILSFFWAWMGIVYHWVFFTAINPAAWLFGALFLAGAFSFIWLGVVRNRLQFGPRRGLRAWSGGVLILFALVIYPLLGLALGHHYPATPTFGLPCPTTIFTLGILMFASDPLPKPVITVPLLWAAIGSFAAFQLHVLQDLSLLASGLLSLAILAFGPRVGRKPMPDPRSNKRHSNTPPAAFRN